MTGILALDTATRTGFAFYDTRSTPSSIECGHIDFTGKTAHDKVKSVRELLPPLIKRYQPDFVVFESPLAHIPQFKKKGKVDMFGEEEEATTINAKTILQLNRIAGAVQCVIEGFRIPCEEVRPMTWQAVIPKHIKGPTKKRVKLWCDLLGVIGKNEDARDAAVIAIWAAGRSQELKLSMRAAS